ncbi:MAG: PKD domain-containing protein, partial [Gammaproteobacteria bacterium]|nr:PKD domain-containing protein [Gammaproteobacteria bacterium]
SQPAADMVIYVGNQVDFEANRISGTNVNYNWNFNGVANSSDRRNPAPITFNTPGTFVVTLLVTGSNNGVPFNLFDQRVITVLQQNPAFPPTSPVTSSVGITKPATDMVINAGDKVNFEADRIAGNVNYVWNFGGAHTPSTRRNPPPIRFDVAGTYIVTLQVTGDNNGVPVNVFDQRTITVLPVPGSSVPPGGVSTSTAIQLPVADTTISAGSSVTFAANQIAGNVTYFWNFYGVVPNSVLPNPGPVVFSVPGSYLVSLQVTGTNNGVPVNLFEQRVITVMAQSTPAPTPTPTPVATTTGILVPSTDMVINVGDTLDFEALKIAGNVDYAWDFAGVSSPSTRRNPAPVTFTTPGTFFISLQITGTSSGVPINIVDQRVITVMQPNPPFPPVSSPLPPGFNPTPPGGTTTPVTASVGIRSPATDTVINAGQTVIFEANPINGNNITYIWDFGTVAAASTQRSPGPVQFNSPGTYYVRLQITGDVNGFPINIFEQRIITVVQAASGTSTPPVSSSPITGSSAVEGFITQPATQFISVRVGQSVQFSGTGFDPTGIGPLNYQWSFGGAQRNISSQAPGSITFDRVGTFVVTLLVSNALGQYDTSPPFVIVSVTP